MFRTTGHIVSGLAAVLAALAGCQSPSPVLHAGRDIVPPHLAVDMTPYLFPTPDGGGVLRLFRRTMVSPGSPRTDQYLQWTAPTHRSEGQLLHVNGAALQEYLATERNRRPAQRLKWPRPAHRSAAALFVRLDPPLAEWPATLHRHIPVQSTASVTLFTPLGRSTFSGTLTRRVWYEDTEDVTLNGGFYPDAVRVGAQTRLEVPPWYVGTLRETAWFVPEIGLARRIESLSGRVLMFHASAEYEYLLDYAQVYHRLDLSPNQPSPRKWELVAVYLDTQWPHPRVGGLAVKWAEETQPMPHLQSSPSGPVTP